MAGKAGKRGGGAKGGAKGGAAKGERLPDDMYDEIEQFHKQKDKMSLAVDSEEEDEELGSDEDDGEEGIYDMDDDEDDEDDDEDEEDDSEDDEKGLIGKMAKQAKLLGQKLKVDQAAEEDDDDEDEDDKDGAGKWGKKKRDYYNADNFDYELTDDEDAVMEEEEEALRLQREAMEGLRPEDYGEDDKEDDDDDDDEDDEEEGEETMKDKAMKAAEAKGYEVERVTRDPTTLTDSEKLSIATANAPELMALLKELQEHLVELRHRLGPVLEEVRSGSLATKEGVSLLEAKNLLLLNYCMCIIFYCLLKAEGRSVKDHPVITRLVQLRMYLEKLRPIEKKMKYQMDKLVALASSGRLQASDVRETAEAAADGDEGMLQFKPRLGSLVKRQGGAAAAASSGAGEDGDFDAAPAGVYRPPKFNPVAMDDDPDTRAKKRQDERKSKEAVRRAKRSETVADLMAEVEGRPEEIRSGGPAGMDTMEALRTRQRMEAREAVEESMFTRVTLSKDERKKLQAQRRAGLSGRAMLDDFADDVADLVSSAGANEDDARVAQKFGADLYSAGKKRGGVTGDSDLPVRESLTDRRAKMDSKRAKDSMLAEQEMEEIEAQRAAKRARQQRDDTYEKAQARAAAKAAERKGQYAFPELRAPAPDETVDVSEARGINREIEKNRGLTPHRSKEKKNPRKKHRLGFAKAQVRRKGQVQDVKAPTTTYGGEETGIKSRVAKSRRL